MRKGLRGSTLLTFDVKKLSRGDRGYFYCLRVGFDDEYYAGAAARKERTPRFNCDFYMQLASEAFISSNPGLLHGGARGGYTLEFPSDMQTIKKEETDPTVHTTRDGGMATLAKSTPIVMRELGDPLVEDTLPSDTPDDQCLNLTLRNKEGTVADVKYKKLVEVIRDPNHPRVKQLMERHGRGTEGYIPWHGPNEYSKRHANADFAVYRGDLDKDATDAEYHGLVERLKDPRFYNCRSCYAFSAETGEPYYGLMTKDMAMICWKLSDYMGSSNDKRYRPLDCHLKGWYRNVSKITTKLQRGHGYQQKFLRRELDGSSVRRSALCNAVLHDNRYYEHPNNARVTSQVMLAALKYGGHEHPRFLPGFECCEYCNSKHDAHHKAGGIGNHIWPALDGSGDCYDISERNGGVLYIKAIGGHIDWHALGRKEMVRAHHVDHYFSIYHPILRNLDCFPGPAMWHTAPEMVSDWLRDAVGDRAILCGGPGRGNRGAKDAGCASLNDPKMDQQATTQSLDHESIWSTFPSYFYDKGKGGTCSFKIDARGITHIDGARIWVTGAMHAVLSHDVMWNRILEPVRLRDRELLWTNPNAQRDELVKPGWMARWIMTYGRPMKWEKMTFDASGMPIHIEPVDEDPRKWVERGGTGT